MVDSRPMNTKYSVSVAILPGSMIEISGSISWEAFSIFEKKAFERLAAHVSVDGFRKGHVPEHIAKAQIGDELILGDMAELALQEYYPLIIKEQNLDVIGRPEITLTKIARTNDLGFTIKTAVVPEIKLPDYKKIAQKAPSADAEPYIEADIDKVIEELRQMRAYGHVHHHGEDHGHTEALPEVDDAFIKSFGDFADIAAFRAKIAENITKEKVQDAKDKRRIAIIDGIVAETTFDVPAIVIKSEQEKMLAQIEADMARAGGTLEEYLKHTEKTRESIMEEFKPEAEKRARFQLIINAIARAEGTAPSEEEVIAETDKFMTMYPGADEYRTKAYVDMLLTNEKVLSMLEAEK